VEDYADWLAGAVTDAPPPRAVVGHSLGAAVAMELARRRPDLVDGLVLMAAGPRLTFPAGGARRARQDFAAECERAARVWLGSGEPRAAERVVQIMAAAGADTLASDYEACEAFDAGDRLAEIGQPVLVLSGARDPVAPPAAGEALARGLPAATMAVVADAGHLVMLDQAATVNMLLAAYLARLELTLEEGGES
jgi:pimeloyl-ACP methyl ester carboxylesterase